VGEAPGEPGERHGALVAHVQRRAAHFAVQQHRRQPLDSCGPLTENECDPHTEMPRCPEDTLLCDDAGHPPSFKTHVRTKPAHVCTAVCMYRVQSVYAHPVIYVQPEHLLHFPQDVLLCDEAAILADLTRSTSQAYTPTPLCIPPVKLYLLLHPERTDTLCFL